jgi:hypothetical protein
MKKVISGVACVLFFMFGLSTSSFAQTSPYSFVSLPEGGLGRISDDGNFAWNANGIWVSNGSSWDREHEGWTPPNGDKIGAFGERSSWINQQKKVEGWYVVTQAGIIYQITSERPEAPYDSKITVTYKSYIELDMYDDEWENLLGDDLYALYNYGIYVSRDSAATWSVDTTGLKGTYIYSIALDSTQRVYLATQNGLYTQAHIDSVWVRVPGFADTTNIALVYVDRLNHIFVSASSKGTFESTDGGNMWVPDSAGVGTLAFQQIIDDSLGNLYAIGQATQSGSTSGALYMSAGGTGPWTRIDGGIATILGTSPIFSSIGWGNGTLIAANQFGLVSSVDHGSTWLLDNTGFSASNANGFAKMPSGRLVATTTLGIFFRDPSDSTWTHSYPTNGFSYVGSIYQDGIGNLYAIVNPPAGQSYIALMKSTNGGAAWNLDTAGISTVIGSTFYVDELGNQHMAPSYSGASPYIYSRAPGGSWTIDTAGFDPGTNGFGFASAFSSDRHGMLYLAGYFPKLGGVVRQPINGGTWTPDSTGLGNLRINYFSWMTPGLDGHMYAAYTYGLYRDSGAGNWVQMPLPENDNYAVLYSISVDSTGALFLSISGYPDDGIYFTTDNGATWSAVAGGAGIHANQMTAYGDTTYAVAGDGIHKFTATALTGVKRSKTIPRSVQLWQNYPNPFNPTTVISYNVPDRAFISLKVYNVLGQQVATLVNETRPSGTYSAKFDGTNFPSGVYFYQLKTGTFMQTKKFVLIR